MIILAANFCFLVPSQALYQVLTSIILSQEEEYEAILSKLLIRKLQSVPVVLVEHEVIHIHFIAKMRNYIF